MSIEVEVGYRAMEIVEKAIEARGTIRKDHSFVLDQSLPIEGPKRVRVIILLGEEENLEETSWLRAASSNEAFDFLKDPAEDIYNPGRRETIPWIKGRWCLSPFPSMI